VYASRSTPLLIACQNKNSFFPVTTPTSNVGVADKFVVIFASRSARIKLRFPFRQKIFQPFLAYRGRIVLAERYQALRMAIYW